MSDAPLRYQKRPIVVEAMQITQENIHDVLAWIDEHGGRAKYYYNLDVIHLDTLEGTMIASVDDYIVKGIEDEFYPVHPSIFFKTYRRYM